MTASAQFGRVCDIRPEDGTTWLNKAFLTIDVDWAADTVLADSMELLDSFGVPVTWLLTHRTPLLQDLASNPMWDVGVHPNFNAILEGTAPPGTGARQVVEEALELVPSAKVVRSHSMTQSSRILEIFRSVGLTHDLNQFVPPRVHDLLAPWHHWDGLIRVPTLWEDDVFCMYRDTEWPQPEPLQLMANPQGLLVANFHPIHVFLNTDTLERYEQLRQWHQEPEVLRRGRCGERGARTQLIEILQR